MQDAAGLLLGALVDVDALEAGQRLERAERQLGVDDQAHPGREQGVAAVQGDVPRRAGGHDGLLGEVGVDDPQCAEVGSAAVQRGQQRQVVAGDLGDVPVPVDQALRSLAAGAVAGEQAAGNHLGALDDRRHRHGHGGVAAGGNDRLPPQHPGADAHGAGAGHPAPDATGAAAPHEQDLVGVVAGGLDLVVRRGLRRRGRRATGTRSVATSISIST